MSLYFTIKIYTNTCAVTADDDKTDQVVSQQRKRLLLAGFDTSNMELLRQIKISSIFLHAFSPLKVSSPKSLNRYRVSQVVQGLLAVFYNLGDGDYNITVPYHRLDDGEWHEVELDRFGREFTLRLDGGGGRQEVTASPGRSQEIIIDPSVVMLGNSFPSGHNRSFLGRWPLTCLEGVTPSEFV